MVFNMAYTEGVGPWKICKQRADYIINNVIQPILLIGGRLSDYPDKVKTVRRIAKCDHNDHKYDGFAFGGGRAVSSKKKG
ncbi:MAG: hypothetical protein ACD_12C00863G0002 [uncultured bacterium]|nr:MAG: hypothetical protein ACD_12C00863G0002 [uncultured bacterium]